HFQLISLPHRCFIIAVISYLATGSKSDLNPRFVHVWRSGEDHLVGQNPSYKNRTSVSTEKLKTGDVSLKITKVRLSDEGTYRCFIPGLNANFKVSPGVLECKSKGWYPEPEVFWLENKGKIISAGSKEMLRGPDDLYVLSSRLTLEKGHSNNITLEWMKDKILTRWKMWSNWRQTRVHLPKRKRKSVERLTWRCLKKKKRQKITKKVCYMCYLLLDLLINNACFLILHFYLFCTYHEQVS
uniref:Uncharacterized protein n=1 Tax=Neolamprologus brichardi TaxID=32507 RepID=A0A3Q4H8X3_NEOBR